MLGNTTEEQFEGIALFWLAKLIQSDGHCLEHFGTLSW